jgi:hypothetical protein
MPRGWQRGDGPATRTSGSWTGRFAPSLRGYRSGMCAAPASLDVWDVVWDLIAVVAVQDEGGRTG